MIIRNKWQKIAHIFTALAVLFSIAGSIVFCSIAVESMNGMTHSGDSTQSSLPMHIDHIQTFSLANVPQMDSLAVFISILLTFITFVFFVFSYNLLPSLKFTTYRKRRQSDVASVDQLELNWLSLFVRSPEFFLPA